MSFHAGSHVAPSSIWGCLAKTLRQVVAYLEDQNEDFRPGFPRRECRDQAARTGAHDDERNLQLVGRCR